jgi:hypothetical protein
MRLLLEITNNAPAHAVPIERGPVLLEGAVVHLVAHDPRNVLELKSHANFTLATLATEPTTETCAMLSKNTAKLPTFSFQRIVQLGDNAASVL